MRLFAIGDVQGCHTALLELLDAIAFDPPRDRLWFCGDLVNRGPDSLSVLRLVRELGDSAVTVLGNHDLHLLAVAAGVVQAKSRDTLDAVLDAPDSNELLDWLRHCPLAVYDHGILMVHAGLAPSWTAAQTIQLAGEVETALRAPGYMGLLQDMYGDEPVAWDDTLTGSPRLRCIINYLTRTRYCDASGAMALQAKDAPGSQPPGFEPWFRIAGRASADTPVIFGHWSTLGQVEDRNVVALDSGCVWGGRLTAMRLLPRGPRTSVPCRAAQAPG